MANTEISSLTDAQLVALLTRCQQTRQFMFFDTARPDAENSCSYFFSQPRERLQCHDGDDPFAFLMVIERWLAAGYYVAGWFAYEFAAALDARIPGRHCRSGQRAVVADLGVFTAPERLQYSKPAMPPAAMIEQAIEAYRIENLHTSMSRAEYVQALQAVLEYIRAGDTYQVNYTFKLLFELTGSPEALYQALRRNQSVAYGAYLRWDEQRVLSFSPELFFRKTPEKLIARPMKGTLARGLDADEDILAREFLRQDEKNRSENVMIVDLLRNDLGRVLHEAGGGTVQVPSLFDVETYESLLQMTSTVEGRPQTGNLRQLPLTALFRALFPCGSVTGAPKIRTMQIIAEQEKGARGVYTGAIGFFAPDGHATFSVPIRTVVLQGQQGEMGIGSGIIHDSVPEEEWRECLLKGRFLTHPQPAFQLLETLLWQPASGYWLLEEHLARLAASASYFYFTCDNEALRATLHAAAVSWQSSQRVRLLLAKDGAISISATASRSPLLMALPERPDPLPGHLPLVAFSQKTTNSRDLWLRHKTTRRQWYDSIYKEAQEAGYFDMLVCNENGEATEGCISSLIIYSAGRYLTPPLSCGLLPGTLRAHLLQISGGRLVEQKLTKADVCQAEAIFLGNSVRGLVRVRYDDLTVE